MNREGRAAELAHRTTSSKVIQALCNYAAKTQRHNLSEKVKKNENPNGAGLDSNPRPPFIPAKNPLNHTVKIREEQRGSGVALIRTIRIFKNPTNRTANSLWLLIYSHKFL